MSARARWRRRSRPGALAGAPRLRAALGVVVVGTVAIVAFRPLVAAGADVALVHDLVVGGCPYDEGLRIATPVGLGPARPDGDVPTLDRADRAVRAAVSEPDLDAPVRMLVSSVVLRIAGSGERVVVIDRPGADLPITRGHPGSVAIPDDLATRTGVGPGGQLRVAGPGGEGTVVPAGVYDRSRLIADERSGASTSWCSTVDRFRPLVEQASDPPSAVLVDDATFLSLASATGQPVAEASWEWVPRNGVSGREAAGLAARLSVVAGAARDHTGVLESAGADVRAHVGLADTALAAGRAATALDALTGSLLLGALAVALVGGATAGRSWAAAAAASIRLLVAGGAAPSRIGIRAVRLLGPPTVVGAATGVALARVAVALLGPDGSPPGSALRTAGLWAVGTGLAFVVATWAAAVLAARAVERAGGDAAVRGRAVPWEVSATALAVAAAVEVASRDAAVVTTSRGTTVDPLVLAFPALVAVAAAGVVARLAAAALSGRRGRGPGRLPVPVWLAGRRLRAGSGGASLVFVGAALSCCVVVFSSGLSASLEVTSRAKRLLPVGAEQVGILGRDLVVDGPTTRRLHLSPVLRTAEQIPSGGLDRSVASVLGIDPASFAAEAFWDRSLAGPTLKDLVGRLDGHVRGDPTHPRIAAIVVGPAPPTLRISLNRSRDVVPVDVDIVGTARAFPGQQTTTMVVANLGALRALGVVGASEAWSSGSDVAAALATIGVRTISVLAPERVAADPIATAERWATLDLTLGAVALLVVTAAIGLLRGAAGTRSRRRSRLLARALGLSALAGTAAAVTEALTVGLTAAALGSGTARLVLRVLLPRLDPAPQQQPGVLTAAGLPSWWMVCGAAAALALVTGLVLSAVDARRRPVAHGGVDVG